MKYQNKNCKICDGSYEPKAGSQKYCSGCGATKRKQARRAFNNKYYYANIEKEAKRKHIWYEKNKGRILAHQRDYRKNKKAQNNKKQ